MSMADDIAKSNKRQSDFYRQREDEPWNSCGPDSDEELSEEEQDVIDYEDEIRSGKIWCGTDKVESHLA